MRTCKCYEGFSSEEGLFVKTHVQFLGRMHLIRNGVNERTKETKENGLLMAWDESLKNVSNWDANVWKDSLLLCTFTLLHEH